MSATTSKPAEGDIRATLRQLIEHLEHVLPAQAAIKDFVHHNTLHGFQHLHFADALRTARRLTGAAGYLPEARFRELVAVGRIRREDLEHVLRDQLGEKMDAALVSLPGRIVSNGEALLVRFLFPFSHLSRSQLRWQVEEMGVLEGFQADVPEPQRASLLAESGGDEKAAVADLWAACLEVLGLEHTLHHPEELLDPSAEVAEALAARIAADSGQPLAVIQREGVASRVLRKEAAELSERLLARLTSGEWTLRRLLLALTGEDLLEGVRPLLIRHVASHLDQGLAAWHSPDRKAGLYAAWRQSAARDPSWLLDDVQEWGQTLERLPDEPIEVVLQELRLLGLDEAHWPGYIERLTLDLPGWSGMVLWRGGRPGYAGLNEVPVAMLDYIAVYLVLERLHAQRLCRRNWRVEASVPGLRGHFRHQPAELIVRHALFEGRLPEYLVSFAESLVRAAAQGAAQIIAAHWEKVALLIWNWRETPAADRHSGRSVAGSAWPLFRLAQHLGVSGPDLRHLGGVGAEALLAVLDHFDHDQAGFIWLNAYERRYRETIFAAIAANHGRGAWPTRTRLPQAQLVFCMDDREEGMRRHLEEINPALETLGAAAHFGVFQNWFGLDDHEATVLCPVVARPAHAVREVPRAEGLRVAALHASRHRRRQSWRAGLHLGTRLGLLSAAALSAAAAPATLLALAGRLLRPATIGRLGTALGRRFERPVPTRIDFVAANDSPPSTPDNPRAGFTDLEQADRVGNFLRNIGLTDGFAPLVVIVGHGSNSLNNPHLAAYDCGACSGRHSGPNARLFAAMANRPEVRALLRGRGMDIPEGTWFVGSEHNTCDDEMNWYDLEDVPAPLREPLDRLRQDLLAASRAHAEERCRRFASAPAGISRRQAWRHVHDRRWDFSQPRPELGHATNAWALIGRRSVTRGAFFDRRAFLISYDPTRDPAGTVLEGLLLANGPVGAGINLEYYFSTVDNERYGCGTKAVHNVAGYFGVMEGASSDLRTGLPRQMIEIHEAMRLLVVVEHTIEVITAIYQRQPPLQELIGGGWLVVAAKDPDSPAIHLFDPARGWIPWQGPGEVPVTVADSRDWFKGQREPLPPALLASAENG